MQRKRPPEHGISPCLPVASPLIDSLRLGRELADFAIHLVETPPQARGAGVRRPLGITFRLVGGGIERLKQPPIGIRCQFGIHSLVPKSICMRRA